MKILFIAEYLLSFPGGAERSIFEELKKLAKKHTVVGYTFDDYYKKGTFKQDGFSVHNFGLKKTISWSRFVELEKNKEFIFKKLETIDSFDYCITQSLMTPFVAQFCKKRGMDYHYYLRDELQLNEFHNYEVGFRKFLKEMKNILEKKTIERYKRMNKSALLGAKKLVANSQFIADLAKKKYGLISSVKEPKIDVNYLKKVKKNPRYILFLGGGNSMKGHDIVLRIARNMKDQEFVILGRYAKKKKKGNIMFMPWQKDFREIYGGAKLILAPSRWMEAFGRVVLDAKTLGIPIVTSNRGNFKYLNKTYSVSAIEDIDAWVNMIQKALE